MGLDKYGIADRVMDAGFIEEMHASATQDGRDADVRLMPPPSRPVTRSGAASATQFSAASASSSECCTEVINLKATQLETKVFPE